MPDGYANKHQDELYPDYLAANAYPDYIVANAAAEAQIQALHGVAQRQWCADCEEEPCKIGSNRCITCDAMANAFKWYFVATEPVRAPRKPWTRWWFYLGLPSALVVISMLYWACR